MRKSIDDYIKEIDNKIDNTKDLDKLKEEHLTKIGFYQHERLIHLLVTLFYVVIFIVFVALGFIHYTFFIVTLIIMVFLICYVIHYFHLENGVQYLYKQYDKMIKTNKNM